MMTPDGNKDQAQSVNDLVNQSAQLLHNNRPGEAVERLEKALALQPDNVLVAINLGGAYIMQRKYHKAVPVLEAAAARDPNNSMLWSNLAAAYLGQLDLSTRETQNKAIAAFERALQIDPQAPNVNCMLGLIYRERGEVDRAAAHFWRALEVNPDDRDARKLLNQIDQVAKDKPAPQNDFTG